MSVKAASASPTQETTTVNKDSAPPSPTDVAASLVSRAAISNMSAQATSASASFTQETTTVNKDSAPPSPIDVAASRVGQGGYPILNSLFENPST